MWHAGVANKFQMNFLPRLTHINIAEICHKSQNPELWDRLRRRLLKTAEAAGTTVSRGGRRHYLLADIALVGEAIMLAMRTNVKS